MFLYFRDVSLLPWCRHFEFRAGHVTLGSLATPWRPHGDPHVTDDGLGSVQYSHSVQYGPWLLHASVEYDPPIALTLLGRIHHEINRQRSTS